MQDSYARLLSAGMAEWCQILVLGHVVGLRLVGHSVCLCCIFVIYDHFVGWPYFGSKILWFGW